MSSHNLIQVITDDHRAVEAVFSELKAGTGDPKQRRDLVDHVISELIRHAVAEEQFVYPVAREKLADGDDIIDHELAEHSEAEKVMKNLEGIDVHEPLFEATLSDLMHDIAHHFEEEETKLLPKLKATCTTAELVELGEHVIQAKQIAPTRPHPLMPNQPPANRILGPGVGFIDTIRDALGGRST